MRMYEVTEDGELKETPFKKEAIDSTRVYIFVNDDDKQIILWNGKDARTRSKFIGARLASSLRLEHGLSYKMTQVDDSENPEYVKNIDVKAFERRPSTSVPPVTSKQVSDSGVQVTPRQPSAPAAPHVPHTTRGEQVPFTSQRAELDSSKIIERLNSIEVPKGFERELIVIGHDMFAVSVSKTRVFGKEKVERKIGKVTNPLEDGIFLAQDHTPRVIIENGRVLAVEFLKVSSQLPEVGEKEKRSRKEVAVREPLESVMEKHLGEIVNIFKGGAKKEEDEEE